MFIQMSNEQFNKEYAGQKIQVIGNDSNREPQAGPQFSRAGQNLIYQNQYLDSKDKGKYMSPYKSPDKQSPKAQQNQEPLNLKGLV